MSDYPFFKQVIDKGNYLIVNEAFYEQLDDSIYEDEYDIQGRIDRNELTCFTAKVTIQVKGVDLASDYLGQCVYESPEDFFNEQDYHEDMIENALNESRELLEELKKVEL